jgi:small subunit ribosomal protein S16
LENYHFNNTNNLIFLGGNNTMAVKIRLRRMGAHKAPFYRVIVADSRAPRDGRFVEEIGYYNPLTEPALIKIDEEKAAKWLKNGAQPTDVVKRLFVKAGIK